jgi:predicted nuclease of restriction endonuclease-like (RecB) superfamily
MMNVEKEPYQKLITEIGSLLQDGRQQAAQAVNTILVQTHWYIGQHIVEFEQNGNERAEYGSQLFERLSKDLTLAYGKGFSRSNLFQIRLFYIKFPIVQTLSGQLTWSHYTEILKADNDLELSFYNKQCQHERWSVRELKRQMKSSLFERLALSKDKAGVLKLAQEGHIVETAEDLMKDPFVLEFLNIPEKHKYLESELEEKIISNLQQFIMEMGKGFAFIGRQYRMSIGSPYLLIADDAIGGFFILNGGGLGKDLGKIYYLSPSSLECEPLDLTYTKFLNFCFNGNFNDFYKKQRWTKWKEEVQNLEGGKVYSFVPFLWTKEGKDIKKNSRKVISIEEQYGLNLDARKQLGLDK